MQPYQVLKTQEVYKGAIFTVKKDTILMPDNKETMREIVVNSGAAAILPIDPEGNIIFVRQYRHPFAEMILEIPAGLLEKDEEPAICAERELEEETGFKAEKISFLAKIYTSVGFSTEVLYIYLAEELSVGKQNLDCDEFVEIEKYPLDKAIEMIYSGEIRDSKTIVALLSVKQRKDL